MLLRDVTAEQRHRDIIQTTQLIKRLQAFSLSENDPQTNKPVDMTPAQVKAATTLLKKTMPDLQSIEGSLDMHHYQHEQGLKELE